MAVGMISKTYVTGDRPGRKKLRVNVYDAEQTDRVEIVEKTIAGEKFTGVRFYLELPVTIPVGQGVTIHRGPFKHFQGDDDSAAVTFWSKRDARDMFRKAIALLDEHYTKSGQGQGGHRLAEVIPRRIGGHD